MGAMKELATAAYSLGEADALLANQVGSLNIDKLMGVVEDAADERVVTSREAHLSDRVCRVLGVRGDRRFRLDVLACWRSGFESATRWLNGGV